MPRLTTDSLKEARVTGAKKYEGAPCNNCSSTLKYTSSRSCVLCSNGRATIAMKRGETPIMHDGVN